MVRGARRRETQNGNGDTMDPNDMMGDDYAGDDYAGDDYAGDDYAGDDFGDDILGAAGRRYSQARRRGRRGGAGRRPRDPRTGTGMTKFGQPIHQRVPWREGQLAPGVVAPSELLLPLGFLNLEGNNSFVNAGPTTKTWQAKPQKPCRPERLVANVRRFGASAQGLVVVMRAFFVGTDNQFIAPEPIDFETFAGGNFGVRMANTQAQPGIIVSLILSLDGGVLAPGDTITIVPTMLSRAVV
jgi:hypothetical protein